MALEYLRCRNRTSNTLFFCASPVAEVPVYKTLTVGVLATGSELLAPGEAWTPGKIYDANGIQNAARLRHRFSEMPCSSALQRRVRANKKSEGKICPHSFQLTGYLLPLPFSTHGLSSASPPSFIKKSIYISCARHSVLTTAHYSGLFSSL